MAIREAKQERGAAAGAWGLIQATGREFSEDRCPQMAAALAYYTALAMPPLLVIIVTVAGWIWGAAEVKAELQGHVARVVGESGWMQVQSMLTSAEHRPRSMVAAGGSVLLLLASATGVMLQLQTALNTAWQVKPDPHQGGLIAFLGKRLLSLAMVLGIAFLLIVSMALTAVLNAVSSHLVGWLPQGVAAWIPHVVNLTVHFLVFTLLFAAMFQWLPDAVIRWSDVWIGAACTAALFLVGQMGMGLYFGLKDSQDATYGVASSFVLLLLWVYYSSMILLLGAEFTQVWAKSRGAGIEPEPGAARVVRSPERLPQPS
jgi:membrane protein